MNDRTEDCKMAIFTAVYGEDWLTMGDGILLSQLREIVFDPFNHPQLYTMEEFGEALKALLTNKSIQMQRTEDDKRRFTLTPYSQEILLPEDPGSPRFLDTLRTCANGVENKPQPKPLYPPGYETKEMRDKRKFDEMVGELENVTKRVDDQYDNWLWAEDLSWVDARVWKPRSGEDKKGMWESHVHYFNEDGRCDPQNTPAGCQWKQHHAALPCKHEVGYERRKKELQALANLQKEEVGQ